MLIITDIITDYENSHENFISQVHPAFEITFTEDLGVILSHVGGGFVKSYYSDNAGEMEDYEGDLIELSHQLASK